MRIFLHDYAGHPFQVGLSRELAKRGYHVTHAYFAGDKGPKGNLEKRPGDPIGLEFCGIGVAGEYNKASLIRRRFKDLQYGRNVATEIVAKNPDIVISGNTPVEAQSPILEAAHNGGAAFVYWLQDFYSIAASALLKKKLGVLGSLIGSYYRWLERRQLSKSDGIILITEDFLSQARLWAGDDQKIFIIENWGMPEDIPLVPKKNSWSLENDLSEDFIFLYSGTLALKHDPELLLQLARHFGYGAHSGIKVVVIGHGVGVDFLREAKYREALDHLVLLPLQPIANLGQAMRSADVLVAVIESEAGIFSVPSKVQTYLCAGRPILLAGPRGNLATRIVDKADAGITVEPKNYSGFIRAANTLLADESLRVRLGQNARNYADRAFDIGRTADNFEKVMFSAVSRRNDGGDKLLRKAAFDSLAEMESKVSDR